MSLFVIKRISASILKICSHPQIVIWAVLQCLLLRQPLAQLPVLSLHVVHVERKALQPLQLCRDPVLLFLAALKVNLPKVKHTFEYRNKVLTWTQIISPDLSYPDLENLSHHVSATGTALEVFIKACISLLSRFNILLYFQNS